MGLNVNTQIESMLFDQNKILTYKDLGVRLNVTPNEAVEHLEKFYEKWRSGDKNPTLFVTYLVISEETIDGQVTKRVSLVNESDSVSPQSSAAKQLSKQIYSLHAKEIEDFNMFYSNDLDASNNIDRKSNLKVEYKLSDATGANLNVSMTDDADDDQSLIAASLSATSSKKATNVSAASASSSAFSSNSKNSSSSATSSGAVKSSSNPFAVKAPTSSTSKENKSGVHHVKSEPKEEVESKKAKADVFVVDEEGENQKPSVVAAASAAAAKVEQPANLKKPTDAAPSKPLASGKGASAANKKNEVGKNQATLMSFFKKA